MGKINTRLSQTLEERGKVISAICIFIFIFVFIYFFYHAVTTTPELINESDSLDYHIPIAQSIEENGLFSPPKLNLGLGYYPAVGESILSLFMRLEIPLNIFNLFSLCILFYISSKLSLAWGVKKPFNYIFAFVITTANSVLRLVLAQTIDIWLAIFFAWSLYLYKNFKNTSFYFFTLGSALGMLLGVKYSGIFYVTLLLIIFGKYLSNLREPRKLVAFIVPFLLFGLSWYIRNYLLVGNPIYPGRLLDLPHDAQFTLQDDNPFRTLLFVKSGYINLFQSLISEYLFWGLTFLFLPAVIFYHKEKAKFGNIKLLSLISILSFVIFLFLPSRPQNIVSDIRYLFPSFMTAVLTFFLLSQKKGFLIELSVVALLGSVATLSQFDYRPKIIILWLIGVFIYSLFVKLKRNYI